MAFTEIAAKFIGEQHRWGDTIIGLVRPPRNGAAFPAKAFLIKTVAEEGELVPDLSYGWFGSWFNHPRWGRQFLAKSFVITTPHDRSAVAAYLRRAPHIGVTIAERLWDAFGPDAIEIARTDPEHASRIAGNGFTVDRAKVAATWLAAHETNEDCHAELFGLFDSRGFPVMAVKVAMQLWGNRAPQMIRKNPYLVMQIPGVGFGRADAMYLDLGGDPARLKRQSLCLWHYMATDMNGRS